MSDEREKWMPSDDVIRAAAAVDHVESFSLKVYDVSHTRALIRRAARAARIEELDKLSDGRFWSGDLSVVLFGDIKHRIAALRAEEE